MEYYMLTYDTENIDDGAFLEKMHNLPFKNFLFRKLVPLKEQIREDIIYEMDEDETTNILYDYVENISSLPIISEEFKHVISDLDLGQHEFIQIKIKNHRGKIVDSPFYIINLLDDICYIDLEKSTIKYSALDEENIRSIKNIVLREEAIPMGRDLFRAKSYSSGYVVSQRFKKLYEENEFEGAKFTPLENFNSARHS